MNSRRALAFIFCTVTLDILALGIMIPVLPKIVLQFMGGDTAAAAEMFGLFATVWGLMQFLFSPLLGALSDRYGRRPVILISSLGLGLDYIFMAVAPNLTLLLVGRIISGITSATIATGFAYIADVSAPEERAKSFGIVGFAFGLGFVLGPARAFSARRAAARRGGDRHLVRYGAVASRRPASVSLHTNQSGFSGLLNHGAAQPRPRQRRTRAALICCPSRSNRGSLPPGCAKPRRR